MNKQLIIQKLTFITEEMRQQTKEWENNGLQITNLEVDAFISNIKYLIEQAEFLNDMLLDEQDAKQQETVESLELGVRSQQSNVGNLKSADEAPASVSENQSEIGNPQSEINSEDQGSKPEVEEGGMKKEEGNVMPEAVSEDIKSEIQEKSEIDNLQSEIKNEPVIENPQPVINAQYKSEQDSLLERLKKMHAEKSLGDHLKEKNNIKDFSFSLNERFFIINQVFNGNHEIFDRMISAVRDLNSWSDAETYLNNTYYEEYKWSNKPSEVEQFFNLIRGRFNE